MSRKDPEEFRKDRDKKLRNSDKSIWWYAQIIMVIYFLINFVFLFFTSGALLYENLMIMILLFFIVVFLDIKERSNLKSKDKINLALTVIIAFFTIAQVWVAFYTKIPRVYTPGIECPEILYLTPPENRGKFSVSFGNYGELPAWLFIEFQNTTDSLSPIDPYKHEGFVILPVIYQNNEQNEFTFKFKVNTSEQIIGFKLRYLVCGDDIVDKTWCGIRKYLNLYNEMHCKYSKLNDVAYSLISE